MGESRFGFNPCLFKGYVYVCGLEVEVFSPHIDEFLPFRVKLPEAQTCCFLVHSTFLVVHSTNYISRFIAGRAGQLILHSQRPSTPSHKCSNCQPVVDSINGLYFILWGGEVLSINLETGAALRLS